MGASKAVDNVVRPNKTNLHDDKRNRRAAEGFLHKVHTKVAKRVLDTLARLDWPPGG